VTKTPRALITDGLRLLQVLGAGDSLSGPDGAVGFDVFTDLLDAWAADRLTIPTFARNAYAMTATTQSYSIGSGGAFNQARPVFIDHARAIPDNTLAAAQQVELPMEVFSRQRWADIRMKSLTSPCPSGLFYDETIDANDRGHVLIYPIPTVATCSVVLYTPTALGEAATLDTEYELPPGYAKALKYNLAVELAPAWDRPVPEDVRRLAVEGLALLATINPEPLRARLDPGLRSRRGGGAYDTRTGSGS